MSHRRVLDLRSVRPNARSRIWRYGIATVCVAAALLLRELLLPGSGDKSPFQTFVLAVLASALLGGLGPGLYATAMGAITASTFYLPPFGQPSVGESSDAIRVGLFIVEGSGAAVLGEIIHRSLARQDELSSGTARVRQLLRLPGAARMTSAVEPLVEPLTDRELEVIRLVALGLRNGEISATLYVSGNTVKTHLAHAFGKLAVNTRTEAVARCAALGLLELPDDPPGTASDGADPERARSGSNGR